MAHLSLRFVNILSSIFTLIFSSLVQSFLLIIRTSNAHLIDSPTLSWKMLLTCAVWVFKSIYRNTWIIRISLVLLFTNSRSQSVLSLSDHFTVLSSFPIKWARRSVTPSLTADHNSAELTEMDISALSLCLIPARIFLHENLFQQRAVLTNNIAVYSSLNCEVAQLSEDCFVSWF